MEIYGYVRVSSTDQNEDRQMLALSKQNSAAKNIWYNFTVKNDCQKVHLLTVILFLFALHEGGDKR